MKKFIITILFMTVTTFVSAKNDFQLSKAHVNQSTLLLATKNKGSDLTSSSIDCLLICFEQYAQCTGGIIVQPPHVCDDMMVECQYACGFF